MSSSLPPTHAPLRAVQVLGRTGGGQVRSLTAGLVARGVEVTVCGPARSGEVYGFRAAGARWVPVEITERVVARDEAVALAALRAACTGADVVHAHGLHAATLASLALAGPGTPPLVVTWHPAPPVHGARAVLLRVLERRAARAASVVLGGWPAVVDEVRALGARDARLAPLSFPAARPAGEPDPCRGAPRTVGQARSAATSGGPAKAVPAGAPDATRSTPPAGPGAVRISAVRPELGAVDRPLLLAAGRLERYKGYDVLLDAARRWRRLAPRPVVALVGEGRGREEARRRIEAEDLPVRLLGGRADLADLLAAADLVVLPSRFEPYPRVAFAALSAGVPLVAAAVGPVPELAGDAALLVRPGDPEALADAVGDLLSDPRRRGRLAAAGPVQAAARPTAEDTVAQVLSVYDEITQEKGAGR